MAALAITCAPPAAAQMPLGNYSLDIQGRFDFHTWLWAVTPCGSGCVHVTGIPQPVAGAVGYGGDAQLVDGRYTLTVDVPDGLRCGNVYSGQVIATHDVYTWDATGLTGSVNSTFDAGCGGAPGGTNTYPFRLVRW
jgi:hypothetical protein